MLNGYLNYFAVPGNDKSLWWFCNEIRWRWLKTLRRRSQTARFDWDRFVRITNRFFPPIRVRHPNALSPLRRHHSREEPGALAAHAGICAGGAQQ